MALIYTPTSELEAVNTMLSIIGEQPVNSLEGGFTNALLARTALHNTSREVQKLGLQCNSEEDYTLNPTIDGYYMVPPNCLKINPSQVGLDVVWRGDKLYDRYEHTFVFTTTSMDVDLTFFLPFTSLPEGIRNYVTIRAARRFAEDIIGSVDIVNFTENDEQRALVSMLADEADADDTTLLDNPDIYKVVNRRV